MNYNDRVKRLQERKDKREIEETPATFEEKKMALGIVMFVVMFVGLQISDITAGDMIGYMIGFTILMLPFTLLFGTLKILK